MRGRHAPCRYTFIHGSRCQEPPDGDCCVAYCHRHHMAVCRVPSGVKFCPSCGEDLRLSNQEEVAVHLAARCRAEASE